MLNFSFVFVYYLASKEEKNKKIIILNLTKDVILYFLISMP